MNNLLVPIGINNNVIPLEFKYNNQGIMICLQSLLWTDLNKFDNIYFIISPGAQKKWLIKEQLEIQLKKLDIVNYKIVILNNETNSQVETIYQAIIKENIQGSICIKDADNICNVDDINGNLIYVYSLENCEQVDPQHKSYVMIDENGVVTNIIEKRVVSKYFNCGCYCFNDVQDFLYGYNECILLKEEQHLYLSNIIYYLILNKRIVFRPVISAMYEDFALNIK